MEIALTIAAALGASLVLVPRIKRRRRGRVGADAGKQWTASHAAHRRAHPASKALSGGRPRAVAASAARGSATLASDAYDWDDDLDWGSDTAVATPPRPLEPPEDETVWDDWDEAPEPGPHTGSEEAAPPARANGGPEAPATAGLQWSAAPTPAAATAGNGAAPRAAASPAPSRPAPARDRRRSLRKLNPLVLVALYAAFGIGVIVIAVSVVSGAMSGPEADRTPRTSATVVPTATPTPPAATTQSAAEARRLQQAFADQRRALAGQEAAAVRRARAAARHARLVRARHRAAARRRAARRARNRAAAAPAPARVTPVAPPTPTYTAPAPASGGGGGGGGGGGCEFCIG